jgi:poly-gamma-glutamate synthesis protein (capsule biosynthesis protein)
MLYDSQSNDISMALTGESLITRSLSLFTEEGFLKVIDLLNDADVSFTNAEMLFHDYEGCPGIEHPGTWMRAEPSMIGELQWAGFDIAACAMNHAYDYGETGVLVNIANFEAYGLPHAGTGANLALARAPAYVDTAKGRVALLAACDHLQVPGGEAVNQRPDMKGKPGVNFIHVEEAFTVDQASMNDLKRISESLGWEQGKIARRQGRWPQERWADTDEFFRFGASRRIAPPMFRVGEGFGHTTILNQEDLKQNLKYVGDARRMADWVMFSFHCGYHGASTAEPADHLIELAHAVIDAGADVFIGHGPHRDKGIEIYNGKPIFYSIGDFILQNDTVLLQPSVAYSRYGLDWWEATPADYYDARSGKQTRGQDVGAVYWQSIVALANWEAGQLKTIELHPIDLGMGLPMGQRGRPVMAQGPVAQEILERFQRMSKPFGTTIEIVDGMGVISVS